MKMRKMKFTWKIENKFLLFFFFSTLQEALKCNFIAQDITNRR